MTTKSYFAFARHALVAGFKQAGVAPGDEIAVPELICRDVLASISAVGAVPRFYPVDRNLNPIDQGSSKSARVVLMVNYFGFPQEVLNFSSLWPNAILFEDNAHGFLSQDSEGVPLGSRTNFGITSIRKTLRLPEGAILSTTNELESQFQDPIAVRNPRMSFRLRVAVAAVEKQSHIPIQQVSRVAVRGIRKLRTGSTLPESTPITESLLPGPRGISHWSVNQIEALNQDAEVGRRRDLFAQFATQEWANSIQPVFESLPEGCCPYGFPFYASESPRNIRSLARRLHCEIISWPDLPSAVVVPPHHFYRLLKVVNFL